MDAIFNLFKIKYTKLDELLTRHNPEIDPSTRINLFINLEPVIRKLTGANVDEYLKTRNNERAYEFISNIINLAAHYRMFFTNNKLYSKVYMYLNYPFKTTYKNRTLNPDYRKTYEHRFTADPKNRTLSSTLSEVIPFTKIILDYVDGVYLIQSDAIESSVIPQIITKEFPSSDMNLILTTDRYDYQYVTQGFQILRPKKDDSYMVTNTNLLDILKIEEKISNPKIIGTNFYVFIMSLLGDRHRDIDKLKKVGLSKVIDLIHEAVDRRLIGADVSSIHLLNDIIKPEFQPLALKNFYTLDVGHQYQALNVRDLFMIKEQIVDKFDNVALRQLNDEHFTGYPINLMELDNARLLNKRKIINVFQ